MYKQRYQINNFIDLYINIINKNLHIRAHNYTKINYV